MKLRFPKTFSIFGALIVITAIFSFTSSGLSSTGPTPSEYGVVLNLSGKQRMLTQKMSKEILLIANLIDVENNISNLQKTSQLFDRTLKGLLDGDSKLALPPTSDMMIRIQLDKVSLLWGRIAPIVDEIITSGKVSENQAWVVAEKNLHLLKEMNKCVKMYEQDAMKAGLKSDPSLAVTINLSGRQRMLTQKMSKEFLLVAYGHKAALNKENLQKTISLFEKTLKGLLDGDQSLALPGTDDNEIRTQLHVVQEHWMLFKPLLKPSATLSNKNIKQIASKNLTLLSEMNKAVTMYEKQAAMPI